MPRNSTIATIDFPGWAKGLNRDADPSQLGVDESPDALNVDFGERGSVTRRRGYTAFSETIINDTPRLMLSWNILGGTERMFYVAEDGSLFFGSSAPLTDSTYDIGAATATSSGRSVGSSSLEDLLFFTGLGATTPLQYDGTSWTQLTATIFDGTASRFPVAAHLQTHHERIFAANVTSGATRHASRVHWSTALTPTTWPASNYIDFDPDDGQEITALATLGESLVVFKNRSVQLLVGKSEDSFTRYKIESALGTESPRSIVPFGGSLFFFDANTGVWRFDGAAFVPLDEGLNRYILAGQNRANAYKAHGYIYRNKYYLSIPWGAVTYPSRTFVFDLRTQAKTEYDYGVFASCVFGNVLYGGGPRDATGIYLLHNGLTDDGTAVSAYMRTSWIVPEGAPFSKFRTRRIDTVWTAIGNFTPALGQYRDYLTSSYMFEQDIDTDPGGAAYGSAVYGTAVFGASVEEVLSRTTGWGNARWRAVQLKVSSVGAADDWELNNVAMVVSSLPRVRWEI